MLIQILQLRSELRQDAVDLEVAGRFGCWMGRWLKS